MPSQFGGDGKGKREREIERITPENRDHWLAYSIDELEASFVASITGMANDISTMKKTLIGILVSVVIACAVAFITSL